MYYFIINPHSRTGLGHSVFQSLRGMLAAEHIPCKALFTDHPFHTAEIMRSLCEKGEPCTVVLLGGDGTINEALQGITRPELITLGFIPIGSGNDFARGCALPADPAAALSNILHPQRIIEMDIGRMTADGKVTCFAGSSGMGFDAAICLEALHSPIKRVLNRLRLGQLTYVAICLRQLLAFRPSPMRLCLDGDEELYFPKAYFACAMNLPYEGGGLKFAPCADGGDGMLDLCVVAGIPKPLLLLLLPTAFFGKHILFKRYITMRRVRRVSIACASPLFVHTDGEAFGPHRRVEIGTSGAKLRVIAGVLKEFERKQNKR